MELWLRIRITENGSSAFETTISAPLELGRQRTGEPEPYALLPAGEGGAARLIFARQQEDNCSRRHVVLRPLPAGTVQVANHGRAPLRVSCDRLLAIPPESTADLSPPFTLLLEPRSVAVELAPAAPAAPALTTTSRPPSSVDLHGLEEGAVGPGELDDLVDRLRPPPDLDPAQLNALVGWLQTTMSVLQSAASSADFMEKAAAAVVQIVGLDSGRVLLLEGDEWAVAAVYNAPAAGGRMARPSRFVLEHVRRRKRTFWQQPVRPDDAGTSLIADTSTSLKAVQAVVAAPILGPGGEAVGALYGERVLPTRADAPPPRPIAKLEATLVEVLACGVANGLARQQQQMSLLKAHIQLEQFFTPEVARKLWAEPDLLEGRDAHVSLLFCDVRGFSRASERLGPSGTVGWIHDVMGELSACVLQEEGVLVDYIGDEMLAMWGAPREQPDQGARAVRAALRMLDALPSINQRWQTVVGEPTRVGIGINSGVARVGNTGSRFKFKYGPLGNPVNLASRVQGLTKYLKCPLLLTGPTRRLLDGRFAVRRVCKARAVNIAEPVDLYEVAAPAPGPEGEGRRAFFRDSEAALDALEAGDFALAARRAGTLLLEHPGDGPLLLVLTRAANMLMQGRGAAFDPVWEPPGK